MDTAPVTVEQLDEILTAHLTRLYGAGERRGFNDAEKLRRLEALVDELSDTLHPIKPLADNA
jgi:hypothetical protein